MVNVVPETRPTHRERRNVSSSSMSSPTSAEPRFGSPIVTKPAIRPHAALMLADLSATAKIVVKGDGARELGVRFGSCRRDDDRLMCCYRPDEVTVIGPLEDLVDIAASMPTAGFTSVIDWTHRTVLLRITGVDAVAVLAKLCSLDLNDHMMPNHACTSTQIARVTADLARDDVDGVASFLVGTDRSFGQYLFDTILDAGHEFAISAAAAD